MTRWGFDLVKELPERHVVDLRLLREVPDVDPPSLERELRKSKSKRG